MSAAYVVRVFKPSTWIRTFEFSNSAPLDLILKGEQDAIRWNVEADRTLVHHGTTLYKISREGVEAIHGS